MCALRISPVTVDNWMEAVKEEAAQDGCSLTLIAEKIGYARPSLSPVSYTHLRAHET